MSIKHLLGESTRPARVDSMDADRMNSIVERASGVNPSKLAAAVTGEKVSAGAMPTAPTASGIPYGAGPAVELAQARGSYDPSAVALQERVEMLERKLAMYEMEPDTAERAAFSREPPTEEAARRAKAARKRFANAKDPADGMADPMKKLPGVSGQEPQPEQQPTGEEMNMSAREMNALGIQMTEWKRLAGIESPYEYIADGDSPLGVLSESDESYDDEYIEDGEMEDEYVEAAQVEAAWAGFLEDRGLSVPMFNFLIDEAIRSDDPDEMDALLAVEEIFLQEAGRSSVAARVALRGRGDVSPQDLAKAYGAPNPQRATRSGTPPNISDPGGELDKADKARRAMATVAEIGLKKKDKEQSASMEHVERAVLREGGGSRRRKPGRQQALNDREGAINTGAGSVARIRDARRGPGEARNSLVQKYLGADVEEDFDFDEEGEISFECDDDGAGNPVIPAKKLKYFLGDSKDEMGMGGMSRRGF